MAESEPALKICLFGSPSVEVDGVDVTSRMAKKVLWLLALLVLSEGRPRPREYFSGHLWPDCDEGQALYNLRRALSQLRSHLGKCADRIELVSPRSLRYCGSDRKSVV